jgi:nucleoside-diphosphate-sugar epimerase
MITILGASGFIGSHIVKSLRASNIEHYAPQRNEVITQKQLGNIIYCIGLTADFREKPFETVEAHVSYLSEVLQSCNFDSLTYLSSARVYINCTDKEVDESTIIPVNLADSNELYNLTKLTGERLCMSSGKKTKIVRLSNVYGSNMNGENFFQQIVSSITSSKMLSLTTSLGSAKDYINIDDAVNLIIRIATSGNDQTYNVASGCNTTNEGIINELKKYLTFSIDLSSADREIIFPVINIERIKREFNYSPKNIIKDIHQIINYNNVQH